VNRRDFPKIHFYDQDFVDIYDKTWTWMADSCLDLATGEQSSEGYFLYPAKGKAVIDQFESIFSSFFLVYSNRNYPASQNLDYFYSKQEKNGAIRWKYDMTTGDAVYDKANPEGVGLPLFAWAEYNLYHKSANKRRIKDVMPILTNYMNWIDYAFKDENGLYFAPVSASTMFNSPRNDVRYAIDFNAALAVNALFMATLGDILNDKDLTFQYKRMYFSLKTRINSLMWSSETNFYHDLDGGEARLPVKTIAGFWPLLAEIPNEERAEQLIAHLSDARTFGTEHPFPTLSADSEDFSENGEGFRGSVLPPFTFMVIKGLERYEHWDLARECTIRHLYLILDALSPQQPTDSRGKESKEEKGDLWEAYKPCGAGKSSLSGSNTFPRRRYLLHAGLSSIALMIENVIGLRISLPRKTVDWIIPNLEIMGIENLSLKRNMITILSNKTLRGWEIQMESEKLYYFTINILGQKKKTLPIPSGKCSMLIDKL
jgi:neutral trehalase